MIFLKLSIYKYAVNGASPTCRQCFSADSLTQGRPPCYTILEAPCNYPDWNVNDAPWGNALQEP